ncbi:MAG: NosD domain-containing protein [Candidatus Bathyarchaeia archaeon]|jgi:nitrous oxidase accessory protein NosD
MKSDKKRFVPALLLLALVTIMVLPECAMAFSNVPFLGSSVPNVSMVSTNSLTATKTIIVPNDYPSINDAIGNASAGDTIVVRSGTYFENPIIDKPLTLQGENSANTIVVGTGNSLGASVFTIAADNVKISGFTITSVNYSASANYAYGVMIEGDNCIITGNNIVNTLSGIFCSVQSSTLITQNNITGNHAELLNAHNDGIEFYGGFNNTISENNITNNTGSAIAIIGYSDNITGNNLSQNTIGIGMSATYSVIFRNNIIENSNSGIYLTGSNNAISANYIANNKYGICSLSSFGLSSNNTIFHNDFVNNQQNAYSTSPYNIQIWDEGYPLGGNYWSDYSIVCPNATEIANSGIMNLPYTICANNTDKYPLMALFDASNAVTPAEKTPPTIGSNHVAGSWSFGSVEPNGVTPDATGNNPAILGNETGTYSTLVTALGGEWSPAKLVEGKFGEALYFSGDSYAYVPASPSLTIPADITIDAWIKVNQFKDVTYNNIVIEFVSTTTEYPITATRILGLAINGVAPSNSTSPTLGVLRGYVTTDTGGFNEIDTTQPLSLNEWYHVAFTRSTQTGMHIYVNGVEQNVTVFAGTQNPTGSIEPTTGLYFGHDSISTLEDVQILNVAAEPTSTPIWLQWWFWTPVAAAFAVLVGMVYYVRKNGIKQNTAISRSPQMLSPVHSSWELGKNLSAPNNGHKNQS